jgi:hypothetical protein
MVDPAAAIASSESSPGRELRSGVSIRPKRTVSTPSRAGPPKHHRAYLRDLLAHQEIDSDLQPVEVELP